MIKDRANSGDGFAVGMVARNDLADSVRAPRAIFAIECIGEDGKLRWSELIENVVTTEGKVANLERMFRTAVTPAWYLMLAGVGSKVVGDTLASHAGWSEVTPYAGNRPGITWNAAAANGNNGRIVSQQVSISVTGTAVVGGAGTATAATGTSGTLYNVADFSGGSRSVQSGDTLNITVTLDLT